MRCRMTARLSERDLSAFQVATLREPYRPAFEARPLGRSCQHDMGGFEQCDTHGSVANATDATHPVGLAGLISAWCQAERSADRLRRDEPVGLVHGRPIG